MPLHLLTMCGVVYRTVNGNHIPNVQAVVENVRRMLWQMRCFHFVIIAITKLVKY